jgi:hypothetical protein
MKESDWLDLQDAVLHAVFKTYEGVIFFQGEGSGDSEEWGPEEAFVVIASDPSFGTEWTRLKEYLSALARAYHQDAIALQGRYSGGETLFIG